jgi:DNA-binding beta-propeller fold protein YncE
MKFNSFTSKLLTSVAALALTSVCANPAFGKEHHVSKGFKVIAVRTLDNTKVADLLLVNGQGGKQFLYLASADGKLSIFDASHPSQLRELSSWRLTSSDTQNFRIEPINDRFVVASGARTDDRVAVLDLSNAVSKEIAQQFKDVDAYAVDDDKQVLYVAQPGQLTVVRFDHPISRDAERFEESYEAR